MRDPVPTLGMIATAGLLHRALADLLVLVNKHGLGDCDAESEPVVERARAALRAAADETGHMWPQSPERQPVMARRCKEIASWYGGGE